MTPAKKTPKIGKSGVVRTTIEIDAELWIQVKQLAAGEQTPMRDLITEGLKLVIASRKGR